MLAFRSFRTRLISALFAAVVLTGALMTVAGLWFGGVAAERDLARADAVAFEMVVDKARHQVENGEIVDAPQTLERLGRSPSIEVAVMTDGDRRVVASSDPGRLGESFVGGRGWTVATLTSDDGSRGFLAMRRTRDTWRRAMLLPALSSVIFVGSLLGLAILGGGRGLFRRFERLYAEAKTLTPDQATRGVDEIATLGAALDTLKRELEGRQLEIDEQNRQIRALTDDLPVGMSYVDTDLRMLFLNRTLESWLGWKRQAILGRRLSDFMTPAHYQETLRGIRPALGGRKIERERDFTVDGQPAVIATINVPDRGPSGEVRGVFSLLRNVTEPRAQEAEKERLLEELAAKNAELERFSYTVSHDLKGPLTTIVGSADLIGLALQSGEDESVDGDLQRIRETAATMRQMLDELLDLARVGLVANRETRVDLGHLAKDTVRLLAGSIERYGTRVTVGDDMPTVLGDRQRLQRVLQNLIDNAVKFSAGVGGPVVDIGRRDEGGETVIFVRDNGCGIPVQQQARVFDLFRKLDGATDGTGIGLAIAHRIITGHGGRIWVESGGAGLGTSFCFTLPLAGPLPGGDVSPPSGGESGNG
ncbi:MAG: PAS domain-containing sensor histidine kinase [Acidobacteriota bacterium]